MLSSFSMTSIDSVDMTLNDAMMRMNASNRKVIHFSMAIILNDSSCWAMRFFTLKSGPNASRNRDAVDSMLSSALISSAVASVV